MSCCFTDGFSTSTSGFFVATVETFDAGSAIASFDRDAETAAGGGGGGGAVELSEECSNAIFCFSLTMSSGDGVSKRNIVGLVTTLEEDLPGEVDIFDGVLRKLRLVDLVPVLSCRR